MRTVGGALVILKRTRIIAWLVILLPIAGCTQSSTHIPGTEAHSFPTIGSLPSEVRPPTTIIPQGQLETGEITQQVNEVPEFDLNGLKDLEYHLKILEEVLPESKGTLQLEDGFYEDIDPDSEVRINAAYQQGVAGDLNADGLEDAVALVAINTGGTGVFVHMIAFLNQSGGPKQAAELLIEDRTVINSLKIENGIIYIQRIAHSPGDAMCCPSKVVDEAYKLEGNHLNLQS